jgi:hypothetical protein
MNDVNLIHGADNAIDSKASNLMAASLVVLVLVLNVAVDKKQIDNGFMWLSAFFLTLSVLFSLRIINIKHYYGNTPELSGKDDEMLQKTNSELLEDLIESSNYSAGENLKSLVSKKKVFRLVLYSFILGTLFGLVSLFLTLHADIQLDIIKLP